MPRGQYPRFKKAAPGAVAAIVQAAPDDVVAEEYAAEPTELSLPRGWAKGAHLNVRNTGTEYRVTLFPEEFDPTQPERCLRFTNTAECQNWVSMWYSRESHDPRAMR